MESTHHRMNRVKVILRIRPMSPEEYYSRNINITKADVKNGIVSIFNPLNKQEPKLFRFDMVFGTRSTQMDIFEKVVLPVINNALKGFNGTIMVYGQTGTGKTWTMEGNPTICRQRGIIPNAIVHISEVIFQSQMGKSYSIRVDFIELYNEELHDLLSETKEKLALKDNFEGGTSIDNHISYCVYSQEDIYKLFYIGKRNRSTKTTRMNKCSSRSHAIFIIYITKEGILKDGEKYIYKSKLHFVDLAGSERQSKSQNEGALFKESTKINQSLSTLGLVISALSEDKKRHVPYRDSKLTRLLQDSLGGNSETVMIATIGPADFNYKETLCTLKYAKRAESVPNKLTVNATIREPLRHDITDIRDQVDHFSRTIRFTYQSESNLNESEETNAFTKNNRVENYEGIECKDEQGWTESRKRKLQLQVDKVKLWISNNSTYANDVRSGKFNSDQANDFPYKQLNSILEFKDELARRDLDLKKSKLQIDELKARIIMITKTYYTEENETEIRFLIYNLNNIIFEIEKLLKENNLEQQLIDSYIPKCESVESSEATETPSQQRKYSTSVHPNCKSRKRVNAEQCTCNLENEYVNEATLKNMKYCERQRRDPPEHLHRFSVTTENPTYLELILNSRSGLNYEYNLYNCKCHASRGVSCCNGINSNNNNNTSFEDNIEQLRCTAM